MKGAERRNREFAVRCGLDSTLGLSRDQKFYALLALRSVAFHLGLTELRKEIDQELIGEREKAA